MSEQDIPPQEPLSQPERILSDSDILTTDEVAAWVRAHANKNRRPLC
jgi:hypothetical protein